MIDQKEERKKTSVSDLSLETKINIKRYPPSPRLQRKGLRTGMTKQINTFVEKNNLIPKGSSIVIGLSGGPDSVFLLNYLATLKKEGSIKNLIVAHLDHEWREDSDKDEKFCREIAKKYDVPVVAQKLSDLAISLKFEGSKEELGRNARRHFLESVKKEYDADLIALAHHAQDQQETFFIRLIRGTSLSGLTAMKPKHGCYIRPLLEINKKDIVDFLEKNDILYLIDPSNISEDFLRNRIRKHVIPALQKCDDRFDVKFQKTLHRLQKTESFLENLTKETFENISTENKGVFYINLKQMLNLNIVLIYRILVYWLCKQKVKFPVSEGFLDETIKFLKQPGSKEHQLHETWKMIKKKGVAHIQKADSYI